MPHCRRGVYLHYLFIPHTNEYGLAAIEATGVDADSLAGKSQRTASDSIPHWPYHF